jgi:hypothetical protein
MVVASEHDEHLEQESQFHMRLLLTENQRLRRLASGTYQVL